MPSDYPLEQLGPEDFQRLCQALLLADYPGLQALPVAMPDGGRDAFAWIIEGLRRTTHVFQVKFHRKPLSVQDPHKWLLAVVEEEATKVATLVREARASEYTLLTNVPGTSHLGGGSIDRAQAAMNAALGIPARCWWRDDVVRRLDALPALRWAFPQLLTGADVLRQVVEAGLGEHRDRRMAALRAFLAKQHDDDLHVRFRQVELEIPLLELFIDVPTRLVTSAKRRRDRLKEQMAERAFFAHLALGDRAPLVALGEGEEFLISPDFYGYSLHRDAELAIGAATALLDPNFQSLVPLVVMEGAPGQGKSTLVQYICQVHRMRLLSKSMNGVAAAHRDGATRLPFKVELRDYAQWFRKENPFLPGEPVPGSWSPSIESFVAAQIEHHSGGIEFSVADLASVLGLSAAFLVLDGLDEVPDIPTRRHVVEELTKGVQRMSEVGQSLQVVVTSRPAAFANSPGFSPAMFRYFELNSITPELITEYAERWLKARHLHPAAAADVRRTLKTKLDQPHMRDLARNPMQLAILLSLIHTRGASLPDKRTALYDAYVDTFFSREAEKSPVVRENRDLLIDIHRYLAWLLHAEAEAEGSDGRITDHRLREVVSTYLAAEGHDAALGEDIFNGMVQRVVALVARIEGTYEFEVQPLREYFAARHLYDTAPYAPPGSDTRGSLPDRFDAVIRDRYWLNVARFLAGCFSKGELASLVESIRGLAESDGYDVTAYPRQVARMLLSDWVFTQAPRLIESVVAVMVDELGLQVLPGSPSTRRRTESNLSLPARSGREGVFERCMRVLDDKRNWNFAIQVALMAKANADRDDAYRQWWEKVSAVEGDERTRWVGYGLQLGVLHRSSDSDLDELLSDDPVNVSRLSHMMRAGHTDYCERDQTRAVALINGLLERRVFLGFPESRRVSPITGLGRALAQDRHLVFASRGRLEVMPPLYDEPSATAAARRVVEELGDLWPLPSEAWLSSVDPWDRIVETGRAEFGDGRAWVHLANCAADTQASTSPPSGAEILFDHDVALCQRARYARQRAGSHGWWERTLAAARQGFEVHLALALAFSWLGPKTMVRLLEGLNSRVNALSDAEFGQLFQAIQGVKGPFASARRTLRDVPSMSVDLSPRTATLLAERVGWEARRELHRRYVKSYEGRSRPIVEYRVQEELTLEALAAADSASVLRLARRAAAVGAWVPQPSSEARAMRRMPLETAREILARPSEYPLDLVLLAEIRADVVVTSSVRPIAAVATDEGWFDVP